MKWFYSAQKEISEYLQNNYKNYISIKQYVLKSTVVEIYNVWNKKGECFSLCFLIEKNTSKCGYNWTVFGDMFNYK